MDGAVSVIVKPAIRWPDPGCRQVSPISGLGCRSKDRNGLYMDDADRTDTFQ